MLDVKPSNGNGRVAQLRVDEGGISLVDWTLERVIIGSCLLRPHFLIGIDVTEHDFWGDAHRILWRAILQVYADEGTCDTYRVRSWLLDNNLIKQAGGEEALLDLTESTIPVAPLPTLRLRKLAVQRRMKATAELLARHLDDDEARARFTAELDVLRAELDGISPERIAPSRHRLDEHWKTVGERLSLQTEPPPRQWLLARPDEDTNRMGNPIGVLPLGKAGMLIAQGGSGKTIALIQLAISVATGRRWLDYFHVPRPGRVLLALAEEDGEELDRRIHDLARGMRLTDEQVRLVEQNVVALGLSGEVTSLVTQAGGETVETDVLQYFRRRLGQGEWSLIVLDTLTRFAGGDTEKDAAQATRFIQAVESLCKVPGSPTVLVAHHTNKISRAEGAATSAANSRGSSALTDGARWVANLEAVKGDGVRLEITKSNYAMPGAPVMLSRDSENGGCLSVENPALARARAEAAAAAAAQERWAHVRETILGALERNPALAFRSDVARVVGGRRQEALAVLRDLLERGDVALVGGVYQVVKKGVA